MKIMIINSSGKIGKSLIGREVFYQNMPSSTSYVEIEACCSGTHDFKTVNCKKIHPSSILDKNTIKNLIIADKTIYDIGSTSVTELFNILKISQGILDLFDLFVVPCRSSDSAVIEDSIYTVNMLLNTFGIPRVRIIFIFNQVKKGDEDKATIIKKNDLLFKELKSLGFTAEQINRFATYYINDFEIVNRIIQARALSSEILSNNTDYKAKIIEFKNDNKICVEYAEKFLLKCMSTEFNAQCRSLYKKIIWWG